MASVSSLVPPKEILMNFLPVALVIDLPKEVSTICGPTKHRIGPLSF